MNLRVVKKKIKSVKNVRKITKAMQMVSAVKMRKAQQAEMESRPYRDGLTNLIRKISSRIDPTNAAILQIDTTKAKKTILIVVTSNKGLAGAFNVNVLRRVIKDERNFNETEFVTVGAKGSQFLGRLKGTHIIADFSSSNLVNETSAIFNFVVEKYMTGEYKAIEIIFNQFISTLKSEVVEQAILPFNLREKAIEAKSEDAKESEDEYLIEPSPQEILDQLLKSYIEQKIRGALISSEAVEHSQRMMAMKSATDNASEIIGDLTLLSNRLRQEKITNELLDMITAKESVES
jgi:F-type H+-transporting ATPase subunit gamma